MVRLQLSDGNNYYAGCKSKLIYYLKHNFDLGFVVDVSIFQSLNANVYAIIRINRLTIFEHLQKLVNNFSKSNSFSSSLRYVIKIDEIELVSQDDKSLGNPVPYVKENASISPSSPTNNIHFDTQSVPVSQESSNSNNSNNSNTIISIDQLSSVGLTRYFHFECLSKIILHHFYQKCNTRTYYSKERTSYVFQWNREIFHL